jgi:hypothetical protein
VSTDQQIHSPPVIDFERVRREVPLRTFVESLGKTLQQ